MKYLFLSIAALMFTIGCTNEDPYGPRTETIPPQIITLPDTTGTSAGDQSNPTSEGYNDLSVRFVTSSRDTLFALGEHEVSLSLDGQKIFSNKTDKNGWFFGRYLSSEISAFTLVIESILTTNGQTTLDTLNIVPAEHKSFFVKDSNLFGKNDGGIYWITKAGFVQPWP